MIYGKKPKYVHDHQDRHGKPRIYLRRPGQPKVALPGPLLSEAFWIAYHAAMAGDPVPSGGAGASKSIPGTIAAALAKYYSSGAFTNLATATQRNYRSILDPFNIAHGTKPLNSLKRHHINAILDGRAKSSTAQAKNLGKRLSTFLQFCLDHGLLDENPMVGVKRVKHEETHYEMWEDADIEKFRAYWKPETPQRMALEILVYTGLRRSDAVKLGPQHVKDDVIYITAQKTGVDLHIPIHANLRTALLWHDKRHLVYIVTKNETSRSEKAFTNWIKKAAAKAGLPDSRSPHGLRRAACRALAEAGCTVWEIMAITGHQSVKEVQGYVDDVDKQKLAKSAISKLEKVS